MKKTSILFVHENALDDAMALAMIVDKAKKEESSVIEVDLNDWNALNRIETALGEDVEHVMMYYNYSRTARVDEFLRHIDYDKTKLIAVPYATAPCISWTYKADEELARTIQYFTVADRYSLPCIMAYLLLRKMGITDFAHFLARNGAIHLYDITRDEAVIAYLSPRRTS